MDGGNQSIELKRDKVSVRIEIEESINYKIMSEILGACFDAIKGLGYFIPKELEVWRDN